MFGATWRRWRLLPFIGPFMEGSDDALKLSKSLQLANAFWKYFGHLLVEGRVPRDLAKKFLKCLWKRFEVFVGDLIMQLILQA